MHFIACKRFHHDRIQNYLCKIIGKECDLNKWYHTKDKPTESETTFNMTFILGPKGGGENQSQQTNQKTTHFFAICCSQL